MDDVNIDAKGGYRRIEVLTGPGRRRRWPAAEKGRIVAETLVSGAVVAEVARRWQVCPQQVFGWRRAARTGRLVLPAAAVAATEPAFVPIVSEPPRLEKPGKQTPLSETPTASGALFEVELAGVVVRVMAHVDAKQLTAVLRAIRASAA
jgi:transposase